jgi:hypothetical protein
MFNKDNRRAFIEGFEGEELLFILSVDKSFLETILCLQGHFLGQKRNN